MTNAACEVWFYHLERAELDQVLPDLLEKTLARGWRALVKVRDPKRIEHLDSWLWAYREDSFLPHGQAGESISSRQPILLTLDDCNSNGAAVLFVLDGAQPGDLTDYDRCILIFDGRDDSALAQARARWTALKSSGQPVAYWKQGERQGWERLA